MRVSSRVLFVAISFFGFFLVPMTQLVAAPASTSADDGKSTTNSSAYAHWRQLMWQGNWYKRHNDYKKALACYRDASAWSKQFASDDLRGAISSFAIVSCSSYAAAGNSNVAEQRQHLDSATRVYVEGIKSKKLHPLYQGEMAPPTDPASVFYHPEWKNQMPICYVCNTNKFVRQVSYGLPSPNEKITDEPRGGCSPILFETFDCKQCGQRF